MIELNVIHAGPPLLISYSGEFRVDVATKAIAEAKARGATLRHMALSTKAAAELLGSSAPDAKHYTIGINEDAVEEQIAMMVPGVQLRLEVTFALPPGIVSID